MRCLRSDDGSVRFPGIGSRIRILPHEAVRPGCSFGDLLGIGSVGVEGEMLDLHGQFPPGTTAAQGRSGEVMPFRIKMVLRVRGASVPVELGLASLGSVYVRDGG